MTDDTLRPLDARRTGSRTGVCALSRDVRAGEALRLYADSPDGPALATEVFPAAEWAAVAGYVRQGAAVVFTLPASAGVDAGETVKVVGDFNGWQPEARWALGLAASGGGRELKVPVAAVCADGETPAAFKFLTTSGRWITPDAAAPNAVTDAYGNTNLLFHPHRSGRHLVRFTLPVAPAEGEALALRLVTAAGECRVDVHPGEVSHALRPTGPLGATVEGYGTRFRVFAPRATAMAVSLMPPESGDKSRLVMAPGADGVWEAFVTGDLDGWRYTLHADGVNRDATTAFDPMEPILDPYAKAAVGPAGPGIVMAARRFPKVRAPYAPPAVTDLVVAEIHLADTLGLAPEGMRTPSYANLAAFVRRADCPLRTLGVNAVELLPMQEADAPHPEARPPGYHWGYMPVNWFSPTSSYAKDPERGSQVEELRDLVAAFHEAGLAVILDVVYNHTGDPNALLRLDKHHYFTDAPDGSLSNVSGCGNDFRTGTPAAVRLIVDSLRHWVEAYDIDGFRFDLAELVGKPALDEVRRALAPVKPGLILIAEPWSFRGHIAHELRGSGYASWSDTFREALAHAVWGGRPAADLARLITGAEGGAPADTLNYTESHDDFCWLDRITENPANDGTAPTAADVARTRMMFAVMMATPGAAMLCLGQESLRTKGGEHNTYIRGDLSRLDPERSAAFADTRLYVEKWIRLRLSAAGALLRPAVTPRAGYYSTIVDAGGLAFAVELNAGRFPEYAGRGLFAVNPTTSPVVMPMPGGFEWDDLRLVADGERVNAAGLDDVDGDANVVTGPHFEAGAMHLPALSAALWLAR